MLPVSNRAPATPITANKYQRDLGLVPTIAPGESKQFDLTYTLLDGSNAVKQATEKIGAIEGKRATEGAQSSKG
jgi:hypothetical protein